MKKSFGESMSKREERIDFFEERKWKERFLSAKRQKDTVLIEQLLEEADLEGYTVPSEE